MTFKPLPQLFLAAFGLILPFAAMAVDPVTVRDIRVEGLQRTEIGTVFNYLPVKVGGKFDDLAARNSIKTLFATGFFDDVRLEVDGDVLIVTVQERPTIAQININGASIIEKDQIRAAMKGQSFAEGRIFQQDQMESAVNELKQQYFSRGRYSVNVKTTVTKLERNRIGVQLDIDEGQVARIKRINIVGNKAFDEDDLLDELSLTTPGWMTWYTKSDQYSRQQMTADQEKLRSHYQDNGYLEFSISSTQVALSEDKKEVYLTLNVAEGEKFTFGEIRFAGELLLPESELRKLVDVQPGEVFSREKITKANTALSDRFGKEGYAFANINPVPELDREKRVASFTFYVDPGRKTYIRRVNVTGNVMTRDEVIRREIRQMEGAAYDGSKLKRSKQRLEQLNYFKDVNIETPTVPDAVDQVDVNVSVAEKKTGNFNVGVGYGQTDGVVLMAALTQANFFGSGKSLSLEANTGKSNTTYSLGVSNPYASPDGISFGWNVYSRKSDPSSIGLGSYNTNAKGLGMNFGLPVSEENRIGLSLNAEKMHINTNSTSSPQYVLSFVERNGSSNNIFTVGTHWSRDTRDSAYYPTSGAYLKLGAEAETPGATNQYVKVSSENQMFYPVSKKLSVLWNVEAAAGKAYGGSEFPFYKNYYVGGIGSVRGYRSGSLSKKDEYGGSMGGTRRFVNNFELLAPMPGTKTDKSMRLSAFVDSGMAWAGGEAVSYKDLRHSAGVAFTWIAPIGPLKISYALPLNEKIGDKVERFQLQLGYLY